MDDLNDRYEEKAFQMGTLTQQREEWAAFLGHTTHESAQYTAARENLMCARPAEMTWGNYCKPCRGENFDWENMYCEVSMVANGQFYEDYCDKTKTPPYGCSCGPTSELDSDEYAGLMNPDFAFFGRGAIQLSWNTNYLQASKVLAESSDTLCSRPELVATDPRYAWGTAVWFWLFNKAPGEETTSHLQVLEGSFGGSLNIINGGLECPAEPGGYHVDAIVTRLRYYCIAARVMKVRKLLRFDGCEGLAKSFENCVMVRTAPLTLVPPSARPFGASHVVACSPSRPRARRGADGILPGVQRLLRGGHPDALQGPVRGGADDGARRVSIMDQRQLDE